MADHDRLAGVAVEALDRLLEAVLLLVVMVDEANRALRRIALIGMTGLAVSGGRAEQRAAEADQSADRESRLVDLVAAHGLHLEAAIRGEGRSDGGSRDADDGEGGDQGVGKGLGGHRSLLKGWRRSVRR